MTGFLSHSSQTSLIICSTSDVILNEHLTYYVKKASNWFMNILTNPNFWLAIGLILIFAELVIPGGVIVFLGGGGIVVAFALWMGWVTDWVDVLTLYFVSSLALLLSLRSLVMRFAGGDFSRSNTIEILDVFGEIVTVIETIGPGEKPGRILFRDTQWAALSDGSEILKGDTARIIALDNVSYIVEKSSDVEIDSFSG